MGREKIGLAVVTLGANDLLVGLGTVKASWAGLLAKRSIGAVPWTRRKPKAQKELDLQIN